jgi:hypothetical protein
MKPEIKQIAEILVEVGKFDGIANGLFAPLKQLKVKTLEQAEDIFAKAYELNNWSQSQGRPAAGSTTEPAPGAVKQYLSYFRRAYRLKLDVISFETIGAMRVAIREKAKTAVHAQGPERPPELRGIEIRDENRLTGALFHDVPALWQRLPEGQGDLFLQKIQEVYDFFLASAPPEMMPEAA